MSAQIDSNVKLSKPFSSDTSEDKQELLREAGLYRDRLETQWDGLKTNATEYGKQVLIIGGVVAAGYLLTDVLLLKKPKKAPGELVSDAQKPVLKQKVKKKKSSFVVIDAVKSLAWTMAIGWAQKKLQNYIADDRKPDEKLDS
jgi:hypothetical protein